VKTKLLVAWLTLIALALVIAGSCSIKHASDQFECETNADCANLEDNRVCSEGLCVVPGGTKKDAGVDGKTGDAIPDSAQCPAGCTQCSPEKKECTIDCSQNPTLCASTTTTAVKCPTGWSCIIKCNMSSSCRNGIDCLTATGCQIECSGSFACRNVSCGAGPCDVSCTGSSSCSGVSCGTSCACDVECGPNANCFNVICSKPMCDTGIGCTSQANGCNTCP
jgi:hypothetical protein